MTNTGNESWENKKFTDVVEIVRGISFPKSSKSQDYKEGLIACLRTANVQKEVDWDDLWFVPEEFVKRENQYIKESDILISTANSLRLVGKVAFVHQMPHRSTLGAFISLLRPSPDVNSKFVYYQLSSEKIQSEIRAKASTTTNISNVSTSKLEEIDLLIPEIHKQELIVNKIEELFTQLDAGKAELQEAKSRLERYRQSVLKAAMTGELTRKWCEAHQDEFEPAEKLLDRVLEERRQKWEEEEWVKIVEKAQKKVAQKKRKEAGVPYYIKDMEPEDWLNIPEDEYTHYLPKDKKWKNNYKKPENTKYSQDYSLPDNWALAGINQLFNVYIGSTPHRANSAYWNGDIPWVSSGEVSFCKIKETKENITHLGFKHSSTKLHPPGTVLLGMIGEGKTRGQAAVLNIWATHNQNSASIRVSEAGLPPEYIYYFLMYNYGKTRRLGSGAQQPALNKNRVESIIFPLPPIEEQKRIIEILDSRLPVADEIENEIDHAIQYGERLRQSILKQAFEGKLL